jgi:hypothetical protein
MDNDNSIGAAPPSGENKAVARKRSGRNLKHSFKRKVVGRGKEERYEARAKETKKKPKFFCQF